MDKLKAEQEKSASFEQQLNDVMKAYKIDVQTARKRAFDDAINVCTGTYNDYFAKEIDVLLNDAKEYNECASLVAAEIRTKIQTERDKNGTL